MWYFRLIEWMRVPIISADTPLRQARRLRIGLAYDQNGNWLNGLWMTDRLLVYLVARFAARLLGWQLRVGMLLLALGVCRTGEGGVIPITLGQLWVHLAWRSPFPAPTLDHRDRYWRTVKTGYNGGASLGPS